MFYEICAKTTGTQKSTILGIPFVKRFALCYRTVLLSVLSCLSCLFVSGVLWPNGSTEQDETWHAGTSRPWPHCVRREPSSSHQRGTAPPIFGPYLLRINGCMGQDATWYEGRPRPKRLCVTWGPRPSPKRGRSRPCLLWPNGWMDRDGTWHGGSLSPGDCVRWGPSPFPKRRQSPPIFGPFLQRAAVLALQALC